MPLKDSFTTIRYFTAADVYFYTTDNRPLTDLKACLDFLADTMDTGFTTGALTVTGTTTLGDAVGDTINFNAGTWAQGGSVSLTRGFGTVAAGNVFAYTQTYSFTGDAGGTTSFRALTVNNTASGANAIANARGVVVNMTHAGSNTLAGGDGFASQVTLSSTGDVTSFSGMLTVFTVSAAGSLTSGDHFLASPPTMSSTGTIGTLNGFNVANIGHALISTAIGLRISDITASPTVRGIYSSISSGAGKHNLYLDGTADNSFAGPIYAPQDNKTIQTAAAIYAGTGAPNNANGNNGDFYFRGDGTVAGNTIIYHKQAGAWVAAVTA